MSRLAYLGDTINLISTVKKNPYDLVFNKMVSEAFKDKIPPKVGVFVFGRAIIIFTKSDVLDDLFVKHK